MKLSIFFAVMIAVLATHAASAQQASPAKATHPFVVKTGREIGEIEKILDAKPGNTNQDIVAQAGDQMRVAVFHDEKRVDDNVEVHDSSDDIYYVLSGTAVLRLGGTLDAPKQVSPGEWRSKAVTGSQSVTIRKGDLVIVPRGTPHQRTVSGKDFSMILIKVFAAEQPAK